MLCSIACQFVFSAFWLLLNVQFDKGAVYQAVNQYVELQFLFGSLEKDKTYLENIL